MWNFISTPTVTHIIINSTSFSRFRRVIFLRNFRPIYHSSHKLCWLNIYLHHGSILCNCSIPKSQRSILLYNESNFSLDVPAIGGGDLWDVNSGNSPLVLVRWCKISDLKQSLLFVGRRVFSCLYIGLFPSRNLFLSMYGVLWWIRSH